MRRRSLILPVAVFSALLALPGSTAAVCGRLQGDPPFTHEPGEIVFVGTAVETRSNGYNALFRIEEIWWGGPLQLWQPVMGIGAAEETWPYATWWEDAPQFEPGDRYLVVAFRHDERIIPQSCGYTHPFTDADANLRPGTVTMGTPGAPPLSWSFEPFVKAVWPLALLVAGALSVAYVAGSFRARRPRSRPPRAA